MGNHRRKRSLSYHEKQIRFLTICSVVLLLLIFTGLIYWISR